MYPKLGIITVITVGVLSTFLITTEDKIVYKECLWRLKSALKAPSSYSLDSYFVSLPELITSNELAAMEEYQFRMRKGYEVQTGQIPKSDILYDHHKRNFEQAQFWNQEADNNNLYTATVYITYDADNSFGASLREAAKCDIIWTGESLKSALKDYSAYDKRSAEVDLVNWPLMQSIVKASPSNTKGDVHKVTRKPIAGLQSFTCTAPLQTAS